MRKCTRRKVAGSCFLMARTQPEKVSLVLVPLSGILGCVCLSRHFALMHCHGLRHSGMQICPCSRPACHDIVSVQLSRRSEQVCLACSGLLHTHLALAGTRFHYHCSYYCRGPLELVQILQLAVRAEVWYGSTEPQRRVGYEYAQKSEPCINQS